MNINGIICLTHSSRITDLSLCSLNSLQKRYSDPRRLDNLPDFKTLKPISDYNAYSGTLNIFKVSGNTEHLGVSHLAIHKSEHKIQHAIFRGDRTLIVLFESFISIWEFDSSTYTSYKEKTKIKHPLLAGLHTIDVSSNQTLIISASAPDAVLEFSMQGELLRIIHMPESNYGKGYPITDSTDLHSNYIGNDYQTTHINMASMSHNASEIIVSSLIPGAIGVFNYRSEEYREVIRGFVGCHGARESISGEIYFVDSATGTLVFLDKGKISRRYLVDSKWLHDAVEIYQDIFIFTLSDKNSIEIHDVKSGCILYKNIFTTMKYPFLKKLLKPFTNSISGNSTQFISYADI